MDTQDMFDDRRFDDLDHGQNCSRHPDVKVVSDCGRFDAPCSGCEYEMDMAAEEADPHCFGDAASFGPDPADNDCREVFPEDNTPPSYGMPVVTASDVRREVGSDDDIPF